MVAARLIRHLTGLDPSRGIVSGPGGIHAFEEGVLRHWDTRGDVHDRNLDAPGARLLAVHGDTAVLSGGVDTIIARAGAAPVHIPVGADAAVAVGDGWLLTEPRDLDETGWSQSHAIIWVDAADRVRAEHAVDVFGARPSGIAHPAERAALMEFPMGQDGTLLAAVRVVSDDLEVAELLPAEDPVIGGFSPDGTRFLVLPYPSDPETAAIASWPSGEIVATLNASDLELPQGFDLTGGYLGAGHVLLLATEASPVLATADLSEAAPIELPGWEERAGDDAWISHVFPVGDDTFVIGAMEGREAHATLWQIDGGISRRERAVVR